MPHIEFVIRNAVLSLCAAAFSLLALWGLIAFGDDTVRRVALSAALLGAYGQFVGQDAKRGLVLSLVASYAAFGLGVLAVALL